MNINPELFKETKMYQPLSILALLQDYIAKNGDVTVGAFTNCREQGFHISKCIFNDGLDIRGVSFSESRNSDGIRVYFGNKFEHLHNMPKTEDMWDNYECFDCEEFENASEFIIKFLDKG